MGLRGLGPRPRRPEVDELAAVLENGRTALGGLFGETWTRLVSDDFGASGGNA